MPVVIHGYINTLPPDIDLLHKKKPREWRNPRIVESWVGFDQLPFEVQMWMKQSYNCRQFRYQRFFRELIETLPKESALRVLRDHLQRDKRYAGREITDESVEARYYQITLAG